MLRNIIAHVRHIIGKRRITRRIGIDGSDGIVQCMTYDIFVVHTWLMTHEIHHHQCMTISMTQLIQMQPRRRIVTILIIVAHYYEYDMTSVIRLLRKSILNYLWRDHLVQVTIVTVVSHEPSQWTRCHLYDAPRSVHARLHWPHDHPYPHQCMVLVTVAGWCDVR